MQTRLPEALTRFVGRERELAEVPALVASHRLVTVTGPGGTGKTRLALEVAHLVSASGALSALLVDLASATDPSAVPAVVAQALGVRPAADRILITDLADAAGDHAILLVLDNCEHLVAACAQLAAGLLRYCPGIRLLATSREPLAVAGEVLYPVGPLRLPEVGTREAVEQLTTYDAVRLFIDRAKDVVPTFAVDDQSAPAVADICVRLDGIPLAIELAAARVNVLSPDDIRRRLSDRFDLLRGRARDAAARQQTLRATVDWSYDLLGESEQVLWRRVSVFAGGFDLAAAEGVAAAPPVHQGEVLDLLARLADTSIVATSRDGPHVRYRMLETLRAYGLDRLSGMGEEADARSRHAHWYASRVAGRGPLDPDQLAYLRVEAANLAAALEWCLGASDRESSIRLAVGLGRLYLDQLRPTQALCAATRALALPGSAGRDVWTACALAMASGARLMTGGDADPAAQSEMREALAIAREIGNPMLEASCLNALAAFASRGGDEDGLRRYLAEAMPVALASGDPIPTVNMASLLVVDGRPDEARRLIDEAWRSLGTAARPGWLEVALALVAMSEGSLAEARAALERAASGTDDTELLALSVLAYAACVAYLEGRRDEAHAHACKVMAAVARDGTLQGGIALGGEVVLCLLVDGGRDEAAATLLGALGKIDEIPFVLAWRERCERELRERLGEAAFRAACDRGRSVPRRALGPGLLDELRAVGAGAPALPAPGPSPNARPVAPSAAAMPVEAAGSRALEAVSALLRLSLAECTVIGAYRRHDERVRNELRDWRARLARPLETGTLTRENFLVWAAPGSGKSFLVQETARALGDQVAYLELNLARQERDEFVAALRAAAAERRPLLCLLDEIDARADESWPYEEAFSLLDGNLANDRRCVFVLVGSAPGGLEAMARGIAARAKGKDMLDRVPQSHRFAIPPPTLEDRAVIVASQVIEAGAALGRPVEEVERLALYYALVDEHLATPRQLRDLAVAAVQNLPAGESRLRYEDLFYRGDSRNQAFWAAHPQAAAALAGRYLHVGP